MTLRRAGTRACNVTCGQFVSGFHNCSTHASFDCGADGVDKCTSPAHRNASTLALGCREALRGPLMLESERGHLAIRLVELGLSGSKCSLASI